MSDGQLDLTREWHWGIAVVGDPAGHVPDVEPDRLVTVGGDTVVLCVRHAYDVGLDDDPATCTLHVRVLDDLDSPDRPVVCDVVLDTPSGEVTIGDADGEVPVHGLTGRTRLVVSAADVSAGGMDEVWLDLVVL